VQATPPPRTARGDIETSIEQSVSGGATALLASLGRGESMSKGSRRGGGVGRTCCCNVAPLPRLFLGLTGRASRTLSSSGSRALSSIQSFDARPTLPLGGHLPEGIQHTASQGTILIHESCKEKSTVNQRKKY